MKTVNDFFGLELENPWKTYIEFGAEKEGTDEREVGVHVTDQDAYDLWHLAVRYKEVLECRRLLQAPTIRFANLPRKEKFLLFYLVLAAYPEVKNVVELGCSVFELIDGLELVNKYFQTVHDGQLKSDVEEYEFTGIELSDLMHRAAIDLHREYNARILGDASSYLESLEGTAHAPRALFDLGVSAYAFTSSQDLAKFMNLFEVAYVRLALSKGDTFVVPSGSKSFVYFSLEELISNLDQPLIFLCEQRTENKNWLNKSRNRPAVYGFFISGEPDRVHGLVDNARGFKEVDQYFVERKVELINASDLLESTSPILPTITASQPISGAGA